jgi:hypothetical protein
MQQRWSHKSKEGADIHNRWYLQWCRKEQRNPRQIANMFDWTDELEDDTYFSDENLLDDDCD